MEHNQAVLNYLYMMEELAEKAQAEADVDGLGTSIGYIRGRINDLCEEVEDDQTPEYHPDWSVVPISEPRYWLAEQSHEFERLYEHKGRKFKVRIRRNAYDAQSWARIEGFDQATLKWNFIDSIPFEHWPIKAQGIIYVRPLNVEQQGNLINLANELTEIVRKLMFVPE